MSKIVNLNRARKRKARETTAKTAAENRLRFGRSKAQKQHDAAHAAEACKRLDQARLSRAESPSQPCLIELIPRPAPD